MPPKRKASATSAANGAAKRPTTARKTPNIRNKASRTAVDADAPSSLSAQESEQSNERNKENTRTMRPTLGTGGRIASWNKAIAAMENPEKIPPGDKTFAPGTEENPLAPMRRKSARNARTVEEPINPLRQDVPLTPQPRPVNAQNVTMPSSRFGFQAAPGRDPLTSSSFNQGNAHPRPGGIIQQRLQPMQPVMTPNINVSGFDEDGEDQDECGRENQGEGEDHEERECEREDLDEDGEDQDEHERERECDGQGNDIMIDEQSPSEEEAEAEANLRGPFGRAHGFDEEDIHSTNVLDDHRQRNGSYRPPTGAQLAQSGLALALPLARYDLSGDEGEDAEAGEDAESGGKDVEAGEAQSTLRQRRPRNSGLRPLKPRTLTVGHYPAEWQTVITDAQARWEHYIIFRRINPFPSRDTRGDFEQASQLLTDLIKERVKAGVVLDPNYRQTKDMDACVFDVHSNFRSKLKSITVNIVNRTYKQLKASNAGFEGGGQAEAGSIVISEVKKLLVDGEYLKYDDDKAANDNFAHPAIPEVIHECFYTAPHGMALDYPEDFSHRVPLPVIAFAGTMIKNCLDEWTVHGVGRSNIDFTKKLYKKTYEGIIESLEEIMRFGRLSVRRLDERRKEWAEQGMARLKAAREPASEREHINVRID